MVGELSGPSISVLPSLQPFQAKPQLVGAAGARAGAQGHPGWRGCLSCLPGGLRGSRGLGARLGGG